MGTVLNHINQTMHNIKTRVPIAKRGTRKSHSGTISQQNGESDQMNTMSNTNNIYSVDVSPKGETSFNTQIDGKKSPAPDRVKSELGHDFTTTYMPSGQAVKLP